MNFVFLKQIDVTFERAGGESEQEESTLSSSLNLNSSPDNSNSMYNSKSKNYSVKQELISKFYFNDLKQTIGIFHKLFFKSHFINQGLYSEIELRIFFYKIILH